MQSLGENHTPGERLTLSLVACLLLVGPATYGHAADTTVKVTLSAQEVYNDNIFFIDEDKPTTEELKALKDAAKGNDEEEPEDKAKEEDGEEEEEKATEAELGDFITTLSPGIELGYITDEFNAQLRARYDLVQYAKLTELNDIDYLYDGGFKFDLGWYTSISATAAYKRDSNPDRDLEDSGLLLGTSIRKKQDYSCTINHELTEFSGLNFTYKYSQDDFSNSSVDNQVAALRQAELDEKAAEAEKELAERGVDPESTEGDEDKEVEEEEELTPAEELLKNHEANDSKVHSASLTFSRDTGALLTDSYMFSTADYMHYAARESIQNNVMMVVGIGYSFDDSFSFRVDGGARYSHEEYDDVRLKLLVEYPFYDQVDIEQAQDEWGPVAHASIEYNGEWTTSSLNFSYDIQPASGKGTLTERTELRFDCTRQLSEFFRVHGFTSYFFNNRDGVYQLDPLADEDALEVHNDIPQLKERLEEEVEPLYGVNEKNLSLGLEAIWDLNRYCTLTGQYSYTILEKELVYSDARRNRFFLRLDIKYPFW